MSLYKVKNNDSLFTGVEVGDDSNLRFFYFRSGEDLEKSKRWLTSEKMGQAIIAETHVGDATVLITRDGHTPSGFLEAIKNHGIALEAEHQKKSIDPWVIRGHVSLKEFRPHNPHLVYCQGQRFLF